MRRIYCFILFLLLIFNEIEASIYWYFWCQMKLTYLSRCHQGNVSSLVVTLALVTQNLRSSDSRWWFWFWKNDSLFIRKWHVWNLSWSEMSYQRNSMASNIYNKRYMKREFVTQVDNFNDVVFNELDGLIVQNSLPFWTISSEHTSRPKWQ